jgi:hypothetical protein
MRIGWNVHHGCWVRADARGAGLSGRVLVRRGSAGDAWVGGDRDLRGRLGRRRHGSQNTGMAERVKPRSREAVRIAQGFTRDDGPVRMNADDKRSGAEIAPGFLMIAAAGLVLSAIRTGLWHEIDWSPGLSIHTVVARKASCGEQGSAGTREGGRSEISGKETGKESGVAVEAKGTVTTPAGMALLRRRSGGDLLVEAEVLFDCGDAHWGVRGIPIFAVVRGE